MKHLNVWAPGAHLVELAVDGGTLPMRESGGWWISHGEFPSGTRYGFFVNGEGPFPDPRSASQPDGVHGLSEFIDHDLYEWGDADWKPPAWERAVVYETHVGTFSNEGTFDGMIPRLEYLKDLGVTHLELMPVAEFPGERGWGYDGVDLYAPHHAYGGPDGLKRLVDACHRAGLAVILDVVYNHLGPDGNYLAIYGPYFTDRYHTPWGEAPNVDGPGSVEVRQFFIDNALMWLRDYRIDGLRLDAIDKVIDRSDKHFLLDLSEAVRELEKECGRTKVLTAETGLNDPVFVLPGKRGGYGLDAMWADDLHHAVRTLFTGEREGYYFDFGSPESAAKALRQGFVYDGCFSPRRGCNHGKSPLGLPGHAFVAFSNNHDHSGNRAFGDRFHQHERVDPIHHRIASAFIILSPFVPMLFMGEEWAATTPFQYFTDHQDPDLAASVSEGRRRDYGDVGWKESDLPDPQSADTFIHSKLQWQEKDLPEHAAMLEWYRELLRLRRGFAAAGTPGLDQVTTAADHKGTWMWMRRGPLLVAAALFGPAQIPVTLGEEAAILTSAGAEVKRGGALDFAGAGVVVVYEAGEDR